MKTLIGAAAAALLALAPAAALACGDTMATANPEQLGLQAPPPASKVPEATLAKAPSERNVKQAQPSRTAKAEPKIKVAATN
jgi:hypothetical protein